MAPEIAPWYVYLLRCGDGTLYTGISNDVSRRLQMHTDGKGAKYTRGRGPFTLLTRKKCCDKREALSLERSVKGLTRVEKENLCAKGALARFARTLRLAKAQV